MSSTHGSAAVGMTVTHRRYVPYSHAHYAGNLVDGAYSLAALGDVATEMCIRTDGDEGLFASYSDVQFRAPVRAGDCIEIEAVLVSQVVTQKDRHIHNTMTMSAAFREAYPAGKVPLLIVGGPRFEQGSEEALGVDRIFGKGTTPGEVASYLVHAIGAAPGTAPES